ncbi:MAG: hypothetical protein LBB48_05370 [Treponema sp.]|jgi:hypothetical protein|nr:hypothetical protein [Treponema sp.]
MPVNNGFAALLKSIAQAPAEYLLNLDPRYEQLSSNLLRKANIYNKGLCDDKIGAKTAKMYAKNKDAFTGKDENGFITAVKEDIPLVRDILDIFLPRPFVTLASIALKAAGKVGEKKENPFAGLSTPEETPAVSQEPMADEAIIEDIKMRLEVFYQILEKMLFDTDFGFIGYYRAFMEEFRRAINDELNEDGAIKHLSFNYRQQIWPNEPEFKSTAFRKQLEKTVSELRSLTG